MLLESKEETQIFKIDTCFMHTHTETAFKLEQVAAEAID